MGRARPRGDDQAAGRRGRRRRSATHFIYPGSAGYDQAGGDHGPNVDYNNYPAGNMTVAEKYMKMAGYPSGKYTGNAVIKLVGVDRRSGRQDRGDRRTRRSRTSASRRTSRSSTSRSMYAKYCGVPKAAIDACPNVGWIRDWSDPQTLLESDVRRLQHRPTNNSNWPHDELAGLAEGATAARTRAGR